MNHVGSCSLWESICFNFTLQLLMSYVSPWALVLLLAFFSVDKVDTRGEHMRQCRALKYCFDTLCQMS